MRIGQPILVRIEFAPQQSQARALGAAVHAYIWQNWQRWDISHRANVCNFLQNDVQCPIDVGQRVTYELRARVPCNHPLNTIFVLHFRIQDQDRRTMACFKTNVLIIP